jgi:catechol 2,3-dioxygenase-like lactoylglutathione lyase family enzyme
MSRARIILFWTAWALFHAAALLAQTVPVTRVEAVGMTVGDMDRSVEFYEHVLHFHKVSDAEVSGTAIEHLKGLSGARLRVVRLQLGAEQIELSEYLAPRGRAVPSDSRSNDLWFQHIAIVVSDMDKAYDWLRQNHVRYASTGPQQLPAWNPQAGGIRAFYFQDPDGHVLEAIYFPPGKGDSRWQHAGSGTFLGIDHTAIVVSDTDASLGFYRDTLGMKITGTSENYGVEQEHLNNVFGAHLRITSLHAEHGAGVELLEYIAPRGGRPIPRDRQSNDLAHWETIVDSANLSAAWSQLSHAHGRLVSSGIEDVPLGTAGSRSGFLFEDPDGHTIAAMAGPTSDSTSNPERETP